MPRRRLLIISSLLCLFAAHCGYRTAFTPTNTPPRAMKPRPIESVVMFTATTPTKPFVEVGLLSSAHKGSLSTSSDEEVMLGLREKAAEVGCDAVLVTSETTSYSVGSSSVDARKRFRAACILFTDAVASSSETQ